MTQEQPIQDTTSQSKKMLAINKTKLVVGEGKEEVSFFPKLLKNYASLFGERDLSQDFEFIDCGGKSKLETFLVRDLPIIPGWTKVTSLGIIIDADTPPKGFAPSFDKAQNAIKLMNNALTQMNYPIFPVPKKAARTELLDGRKTAIWIMPDNQSQGELEDLCLKALEQHALRPCICQMANCARSTNTVVPTSAKASLYTLLAWIEPPGKRLGELDNSFVRTWDLRVFQPILQSFFYQL